MSTTPTTPTLDDLRQAAVAAESTPATPAPPAQPEVTEVDGIKYGKTPEGKLFAELPTGAKYLGDNEQQLAINIAKGKVEADRTLQQWKQQNQPQPAPQPQIPQEDPTVIAARQYMIDEIAKGMGLSNGQELVGKLEQFSHVASTTADDQIAAQFYQLAPDFPTTEQNVELLTNMVETMGLPMTPYGLQAAHLIAVNQGKYKPLTAQEIQAQKMQALGINPATIVPPTPAPVLPGQASVPNSGAFNPYDRKNSIEEVRRWAMEQK